jgi:hypothetical protein
MKHHLLVTSSALLAAVTLAGCVVVPARPAYVGHVPEYDAPPQVYVVPPPIFFGPRIWFGGHWNYHRRH